MFNPYFIIIPICEILLRLDLDKEIKKLYNSGHIKSISIEKTEKILGCYFGDYFYKVCEYILPYITDYYANPTSKSLVDNYRIIFYSELPSNIIIEYENILNEFYNNSIINFLKTHEFKYSEEDNEYDDTKWLKFIDSVGQISDTTELEELIINFYIPDKISLDKFLANQKSNAKARLGKDIEFLHLTNVGKCTPTFKEYFSKNTLNRIPLLPDWFYQAYPDVALWIHMNKKSLFNDIIKNRESEYVDEKGQIKYTLYRALINIYKKNANSKLECSE